MECNIDFFKWMFGKAGKPFEIIEYPNGYNHYRIPHKEHSMEIENTCYALQNDKADYSLLLQKAIEGVNRQPNKRGTKYLPIMIDSLGAHIHSQWHDIRMDWGSSPDIDKAKESALKYIYEQETK